MRPRNSVQQKALRVAVRQLSALLVFAQASFKKV